MGCECITVITTFVGLLIALITIDIGLKQYKNENRFKKAAQFFELRRRFKENQNFTEIRERLNNHQNLDGINNTNVFDFAGFLEELQIAINSKFIEPEMVYYLFGHYILEFADYQNRVPLEAPLWTALNELVINMRAIKNNNTYTNNLKF